MPRRPGTQADRRQAILWLLAFGVAWAFLELVVGGRLQKQYHLMQVVWFRYAFHLLAMSLVVGLRDPRRLWRTTRLPYQLARSFLMFVMPASFTLALATGVQADTTWAGFWVAPILVVVLSPVIIGEAAPTWVVFCVMAGLPAVALVHPFTMPSPWWLLLLPFVMAASFALYVVMTRSLRDQPMEANLFYTALGVFLILTPAMPRLWVTPTPRDLVVMAAIGIVGLVALLALDRAAAALPVSLTAPALYGHVLAVALLSWILGAGMSHRAIVGAAVLSVLLVIVWSRVARSGATAVSVAHGSLP